MLLWRYGFFIAFGFWVIAIIRVWRHRKRELEPKDLPFFEHKPYGTDARSLVPWMFYRYACFSQFSPVGAISRLASEKNSLRYIDGYILGWGLLAFAALHLPNQIDFFVPLFVSRFLEYTSIIIYQRMFGAGHPKRIEKPPEPFEFNYRVLLIDIINYLIFALMFAAYYRGNAELIKGVLDPESNIAIQLTSATDAFYFSIVTMATLGYGDFRPEGHLRGVVVLQVLFGLFMVVVIIGVLIGERKLYLKSEEKEEREKGRIRDILGKYREDSVESSFFDFTEKWSFTRLDPETCLPAGRAPAFRPEMKGIFL